MRLPGCGPLCKAVVTPAVHPNLPITPGLFANPVNHRISVSPVVFKRRWRIRTAPLAARVCYDAGVNARGRVSGLREVVVITGIDCESEQRWLRRLRRFRPYHLRGDAGPIRRGDED